MKAVCLALLLILALAFTKAQDPPGKAEFIVCHGICGICSHWMGFLDLTKDLSPEAQFGLAMCNEFCSSDDALCKSFIAGGSPLGPPGGPPGGPGP